MDYIFLSAILTFYGLVFLTYDIYCQYIVHACERFARLPECLRCGKEFGDLKGGIPVWHGEAHCPKCRAKFQVQYQRGAGKVDGEGPERVWAKMNEIAFASKEMGAGTRHDAFDNYLDHHNHEKNVKLGEHFMNPYSLY
jgi:DNA-directed RNA polymerase subunit RPC12/RpoP